mmetsp:Transcript_32943/g.80077  ORF Transcript_32943/g.80077 Transcript_32943/m.80077 type:complete len:257 (-) Transcript_32943:639-1409(-)
MRTPKHHPPPSRLPPRMLATIPAHNLKPQERTVAPSNPPRNRRKRRQRILAPRTEGQTTTTMGRARKYSHLLLLLRLLSLSQLPPPPPPPPLNGNLFQRKKKRSGQAFPKRRTANATKLERSRRTLPPRRHPKDQHRKPSPSMRRRSELSLDPRERRCRHYRPRQVANSMSTPRPRMRPSRPRRQQSSLRRPRTLALHPTLVLQRRPSGNWNGMDTPRSFRVRTSQRIPSASTRSTLQKSSGPEARPSKPSRPNWM